MIRAHGKSEIYQARIRRAFEQARLRQARDRARLFAQQQADQRGAGCCGGLVMRREREVRLQVRKSGSLISARHIPRLAIPRVG
jgi:hypothetical protein